MPLLTPDEITIANLTSDLATKRSTRNQLAMQLQVLREGLQLPQNTLERRSPLRQYTVIAGDTLPIISVRLWGTTDHWRSIAQLNAIEYPYIVVVGQKLKTPEI